VWCFRDVLFYQHAAPRNPPPTHLEITKKGDYVALACEPLALVGVDVAAPSQLRGGGGAGAAGAQRPFGETLTALRGQLSDREVCVGRCVCGGGERGYVESCFRIF
jgi:4'-phosphopantetheinyl transferase